MALAACACGPFGAGGGDVAGAVGPDGSGTTGGGIAGVGAEGRAGACWARLDNPGAGGPTGPGGGVGAGATGGPAAADGESIDAAAIGFAEATGAGRALAGALLCGCGCAIVGFSVGADSVSGAPQNLQNAAAGSQLP